MTYCCGILVRDGLVMIADTRTNAGPRQHLDLPQAARVRASPASAIMALASAGNLSLSQSVRQHPDRGHRESGDRRARDADERADHVPGGAAHRPRRSARCTSIEGAALEAAGRASSTSPSCSAARSRASALRLFMIYAAGNFIECTTDTPYLQIGEHKYGKPILDRAVTYDIDLYDALKIGLISMDSTMRSNLGVGMPIDILVAAARRLRGRARLPHRAGRALFPRPARALVGGAARRAHGHSAPALRSGR